MLFLWLWVIYHPLNAAGLLGSKARPNGTSEPPNDLELSIPQKAPLRHTFRLLYHPSDPVYLKNILINIPCTFF